VKKQGEPPSDSHGGPAAPDVVALDAHGAAEARKN